MKTEFRYGKRIREERLKRGWTQEHLAEAAGIASRTIARIEKSEMRGLESLMAISAAFAVDLKDLAQTIRVAEAKPLRSLAIRRTEDLQAAFTRAHDSGLYRTVLVPLRADRKERAEELLEVIFSDLQYLSPDEPDLMRSWIASAKDPLEELHSMGMELFSIQDSREVFVGLPGRRKELLENWTIGYYLLVLEHSCFSAKNCVHRFHDKCAAAVSSLHDWLRQEQDGKEVNLYMFANEFMVTPIDDAEQSYCDVCFPNGPTGECLTDDYLRRVTGLSAEAIRDVRQGLDALPGDRLAIIN